jgi:anti-anti-sigma regulatory factor
MPSEEGAPFAAERSTLPDGSIHVAVSGMVDATSSCGLLDVLIQGITPGRTLIVNLAAVTYADDTGMAALAVADRIASLYGSELRVLGCTGEAERVLAALKTSLADTSRIER